MSAPTPRRILRSELIERRPGRATRSSAGASTSASVSSPTRAAASQAIKRRADAEKRAKKAAG